MTARAASTARTGREILDATAALWRERPIHELTLDTIAARAGVTVRTILRRPAKQRSSQTCPVPASD